MNAQDRGVRKRMRRLSWVFPGKREEGHASPGESLGEPATHTPLVQDMMSPDHRWTVLIGHGGHVTRPHNAIGPDATRDLPGECKALPRHGTHFLPLRGNEQRQIRPQGHTKDAEGSDVLLATQKIAGAQKVWHEGMQ